MAFADRFQWYCQKVLPLVYDESLSYYEVLCKLTEYIKELSQAETDLEAAFQAFQLRQDELENQFGEIVIQWQDYKNQMDSSFSQFKDNQTIIFQNFEQQVKQELAEMANTLDQIKNGDYVDLYLDSIKSYIDQNLQNFVANIVKFIVFGLDNTGHLVAYIPPNWNFLQFDTIEDGDLYGHLVLRW